MTSYVASRELRNDTAGVLKRVQQGDEVIITVRGEPVAEIIPIRKSRRHWMSRDELIDLLDHAQADPGLRDDLRRIAGDTTDDLGPIR
ncbi:MAG TPA: type II toxin-antitoxin system prevent-host-death family antitoxin [Jatrophihabitantaceae bacterium]|jgi:prevent-host-death family protein